ncbi:MAG: Hsp20/alpha crystallin family protein [Gaiellaceae bacterium]
MLMRFDPFRDLDRIAQELTGAANRAPRAFPMDAYRRGDQVVLLFDLPGIDPQSIDLTVDQNVLTIRAERQSGLGDGMEVLAAERPQGTFTRSVFLGDALDSDRIAAAYRNGVLELTIPVSERAKPRKIEVASNGGQLAEPVATGA